ALLALAQLAYLDVVGRAFGAVVPGQIVVGAVAVVLAVGLVVLVVVRDEVAEREAVVGGHEVDRGVGRAGTAPVQIAGAGQPVAHVAGLTLIALPEGAHGVAIDAVPF